MTLIVGVQGPLGIVLAADSRGRATFNAPGLDGRQTPYVYFDEFRKLLRFRPPHDHIVAAVAGSMYIPGTDHTIHSLLPDFEKSLKTETKLSVYAFAKSLASFYKNQINKLVKHIPPGAGISIKFCVAGYSEEEPQGKIFEFEVPGKQPMPKLIDKYQHAVFALGDTSIIDRLRYKDYDYLIAQRDLPGYAEIVRTLIDVTIQMQRIAYGWQSVGGPINLTCITPRGGIRSILVRSMNQLERPIIPIGLNW